MPTMKGCTFKINGQEITVEPGTRLIEAARQVGVEIPHFCYHPALSAPANCRMCLVEQKGGRRPIPACSTVVADGIEIQTETEEIRKARQSVMEFLLINHPLDCPTCDEAGECRLQDYTMLFGVPHSRFEERKQTKRIDNLSPAVQFWGNRCIACTRCVRFTQEVSGTGELGLFQRGDHNEIGVFPGKTLDNPISMNVIDICPVGALLDRTYLHKTRYWFLKHTESTCASCAKGCSISVDTDRGEIMRLMPRYNPKVNDWWMCDRGRLNYAYAHDPNRLRRPKVRAGGIRNDVSWEEAIEAVRAGFAGIAGRHGKDAVAGWASAWATHEELFLFRKLMEAVGSGVAGILALPDLPEVRMPKFTIPADQNPNRRAAMETVAAGFRSGGIAKAGETGVRAAYVLAGIPNWTPSPDELAYFGSLEFLVVQDILPGPLTELAHVLLPGATAFEKDGTFANDQGILQPIRAATTLIGDSREDWQVLSEVASAFGLGWTFRTLDDVREKAVPRPAAAAVAALQSHA